MEETRRDPAQLGRAAGSQLGEAVWLERPQLTFADVTARAEEAARAAAESSGTAEPSFTETFVAGFQAAYYEVARAREEQARRELAQREALSKFVAYARFMRGFAIWAYVIAGAALVVFAIIAGVAVFGSGRFDAGWLRLPALGLAAVAAGVLINRHSMAGLVLLGLILAGFGLGLVVFAFNSSATVIVIPIGAFIVTVRRFRAAGTAMAFLQQYKRDFGRTTLKAARAQLAADPKYWLAQLLSQGQRRQLRRAMLIAYGILGGVAVVVVGGIAILVAHQPSQRSSYPAIPFAQSVASNLHVTATLSTDTQQKPDVVTIKLSQYPTGGVEGSGLGHGETWTCDGVALVEDKYGDFTADIPLLPVGDTYRCDYHHGSDVTPLTFAGGTIPHIVSPKEGESFAAEPVSGGYVVLWTPDAGGTSHVRVVATLDGSPTVYPATSGDQPDDGAYTFTITTLTGQAAPYDGPGSITLARTYGNVAPQGFGSLELTTVATTHVVWVGPDLFASPTPGA